jgi:hypothetical protein
MPMNSEAMAAKPGDRPFIILRKVSAMPMNADPHRQQTPVAALYHSSQSRRDADEL